MSFRPRRLVAPLQRPRGERRLEGHRHLVRGLPPLLPEGRRRGEDERIFQLCLFIVTFETRG